MLPASWDPPGMHAFFHFPAFKRFKFDIPKWKSHKLLPPRHSSLIAFLSAFTNEAPQSSYIKNSAMPKATMVMTGKDERRDTKQKASTKPNPSPGTNQKAVPVNTNKKAVLLHASSPHKAKNQNRHPKTKKEHIIPKIFPPETTQ